MHYLFTYIYTAILNLSGMGVDFDSGPFFVVIEEGQSKVNFSVSITNDELCETDETFTLTIVELLAGFGRKMPYEARVVIYEDDCK